MKKRGHELENKKGDMRELKGGKQKHNYNLKNCQK